MTAGTYWTDFRTGAHLTIQPAAVELGEDLDAAIRTADRARVEQALAAVAPERRVALAATLIETHTEWRKTPLIRAADLRSFRLYRYTAVRADALHAQMAAAMFRTRAGVA